MASRTLMVKLKSKLRVKSQKMLHSALEIRGAFILDSSLREGKISAQAIIVDGKMACTITPGNRKLFEEVFLEL